MRVVICAMAKNEHLYINEWVEHYLKLGFDKIYLYDNDDVESPKISDVIFPSFKNKVEIIDIRGQVQERLQHDIYTNFYNTHKNDFDYCLFCDVDEFLVGINEIHNFLSQPRFRHAYQIRIKWRLFGDDDLIVRDMSKGVKQTFLREIKHSLNKNLIENGNLERQGKMIVKGGLGNVVIRSPHFASFRKRDNVIPSMLPSGKPCFSKIAIREDYSRETVFLNHYMTKSLSEFVFQKLGRTDAVFADTLKLNYYWRINTKTQEKLEWLKERNLFDGTE